MLQHPDWAECQQRSDELLGEGVWLLRSQQPATFDHVSSRQASGIYIVRTDTKADPLYIGESSDLAERHDTHSGQTYFSALRRHIATEVIGFSLKVRNGKAKYLNHEEDQQVSVYLNSCLCAFVPVSFGRYELEEHLIRKYHPVLNRKGNQLVIEPDV